MKAPTSCPLCGASRDWVCLNSYYRGFSWPKALLASVFFGKHLGALAGLQGRKKLLYYCKSCGFSIEYDGK